MVDGAHPPSPTRGRDPFHSTPKWKDVQRHHLTWENVRINDIKNWRSMFQVTFHYDLSR